MFDHQYRIDYPLSVSLLMSHDLSSLRALPAIEWVTEVHPLTVCSMFVMILCVKTYLVKRGAVNAWPKVHCSPWELSKLTPWSLRGMELFFPPWPIRGMELFSPMAAIGGWECLPSWPSQGTEHVSPSGRRGKVSMSSPRGLPPWLSQGF